MFFDVFQIAKGMVFIVLEYGPYGITVFVLLTRRETRSFFNAPMKTFRLDQVGFSQG